MNVITICIICIIIFIIYYSLIYSEVHSIKSDIDNNYYMIRRGNDKSVEFFKESADVLAIINGKVIKLINHLASVYSNDESKNYFIKKLVQNYNHSIISEAAVDPRYTTYTVNKKDMHICLRTRDNYENIYDINVLMYVILHELAHLCNYDKNGNAIQGHGSEFKYIFKFLTEEAINIGIYKHTNYNLQPTEYCGITISSSII